jgi:parallel beta-helix repeat protein
MVENCILYGYEGSKPKEAIQLDIVHNDDLVPSMQVVKIKYDDLACDGIIIRNNEIYNYPRAIGSHTSVKGVFHKNITITQNYLHDLEEAAIKAYNYINLVISNNTIENSAIGVLAYTTLDNETGHYLDALPGTQPESLPTDYKINITENTIKNIHQYKTGSSLLWGDGIRIIGSKDRILPGISISKNKISDTKRSGIYVSYAPKGYIGSNTITGTSWHALYVDQCEASKVYYNKINTAGKAGSTYGGIGISSSGNSVIYKNTVKAAAKNGIFLYNSSTGCTIKANSINAAADNAIAVNLSSNNAKIISNKITGNTKSSLNNRGIFVYGANYASITLNTISSCRAKQEINTNNSKGSKISNNKINK